MTDIYPVTILVIDDDPFARLAVQRAVPDTCRLFLATDGLTGLDMARQLLAEERLDLVILDIQMPGMEGCDVCAQIRRESDTVHILPITRMQAATSFLAAFSCLPMVLKPVSVAAIEKHIRQGLQAPPPPPAPARHNPFLSYVMEHATAAEQRARYDHPPLQVLVSVEDFLARMGLVNLVSIARTDAVVREMTQATALPTDAGRATVVVLTKMAEYQRLRAAYAGPFLVMTETPEHYRLLQQTDSHCSLVYAADASTTVQRLRDALRTIETGGVYRDPSTLHHLFPGGYPVLPHLTPREAEVVLLDYAGYPEAAIADHMGLSHQTVRTYWKRICHKLTMRRGGVRTWVRHQIVASS